ncbi:MAG: nucleoside monophosphate kinase [Candidatus Cloacimonetes bacterium]|nr:nucleoside monophosphate kinase [Candidatus Cloacimonadota bacterium]
MIFVFLGIQGSGKGTQAKLLSKHFDIEHVNLGEYFRKHMSDKSSLGVLAHAFISEGRLVPDEIVCEIVSKLMLCKGNGYVFDGFPRTLNQAEYLNYVYPVNRVYYLELEDNIARERMLSRRICSDCRFDYNLQIRPPKIENICDNCGGAVVRRADDTIELIQNRLDLFHAETQPLNQYYQNLGILSVINANNEIDKIHEMIVKEAK